MVREPLRPESGYLEELPEKVLTAVLDASPPAFFYDAEGFKSTVRELVDTFEVYAFPVKANPHPAFLEAAFETGAAVDACSSQDIDLAEAAGFHGDRLSFTAPVLTNDDMRRLAGLNAMVDMNSTEDAERWIRLTRGRPLGFRLADDSNGDYGAKFGVPVGSVVEFARLNPDVRVAGLHIHGTTPVPNGVQGPLDPLRRLLASVPHSLAGQLEYVNIGGGWWVGDRPAEKAPLQWYAGEVTALGRELRRGGFVGRVIVEPGDWAAIDHGWWSARVAAVRHREEGHKVVILDTNTPMPSRGWPTPFALVRNGAVVKSESPTVVDMYGSANNQRDLFGRMLAIPEPRAGDLVVFARCGAYVRSLIGTFNERPVPRAVLL